MYFIIILLYLTFLKFCSTQKLICFKKRLELLEMAQLNFYLPNYFWNKQYLYQFQLKTLTKFEICPEIILELC